MKVALIHDHLAQDGGAEKVLKVFTEMFPEAPIFTLLCEPGNAAKNYCGRQIDTSIIQKFPGGVHHYQWYMPFMPMAVEFFDLSKYDLVISDSASFAKGVITKPETLHIDYCHTPTRYLWSDTHQYINELKYNKWFKKVISLALNYVRIWDRLAADRVDCFIANSEIVKRRIAKYYRRDAEVIYPPVDTEFYNVLPEYTDEELKKEKYFLAGCRLAPYKRVDIIIKVFKEMPDKKLKIFGNGVDENRLKKLAIGAGNIQFLGRVNNQVLAKLYCNAQAFIHPQEEDFGISAVEAMACGVPVIAFEKGGAKETVISMQTGVFFKEQTAVALKKAIKEFETIDFDKKKIRSQAEKFSIANFKAQINDFIYRKIRERGF
jgi:glycosyltransferase involved in cell wall biosynthesis